MHPTDLVLETLCHKPAMGGSEVLEAWNEADARGLSEFIRVEAAAVWLYVRFKELHCEPRGPDGERFWHWLTKEAKRIAAKRMLVDSQTSVLSRHLSDIDVPFVLIKGSARQRATHLYPFVAARDTNDLDVLIPENSAETTHDYLRAIGYDYAFAPELTPEGHYHLRPLADESSVPVELHVSTGSQVPPAEAWRRNTDGSVEISGEGVSYRIPSATELLWHGITHGVFHEARAYRLRFLLDATAILASDVTIDWSTIDQRLDSVETDNREQTVAWLGAAAWLAGVTLPEQITKGVKPFPLRRVMRWRLVVFRNKRLTPRMREKLLEEGTRVEAGMSQLPTIPGSSLPVRMRRRTAAAAARASYLTWRFLHRD